MAQDQVEEIKRKTDIVELISEYVNLARSGRNFKALCPFHSEKTPSFVVSPELGIFKCFGCGVGGDAYTFLQEYEKIDFPQALKMLADRAGVKLKPLRGFRGYEEKEEIFRANYLASEFYHYLLTSHAVGKKALAYLRGRGITDEAVEVFRLGYAPNRPDVLAQFLEKKGYKQDFLQKAGLVIRKQGKVFDRFRDRVIFPLHDHLGNVTGFAGRVLENKGEVAKYINSPETAVYKKGRLLYGLHITKQDIKDKGCAVVVEGELDSISSWQAGVRNVVSLKGSVLTEDQTRLLSRFCQEIRLATDADLAGSEAARRGALAAAAAGLAVRVVKLDGFKDPDEAAQKKPSFWQKAVKQAQEIYDFLLDSAFNRYDARTTEGKRKVSRELAPVIGQIEDAIVKADVARKLAVRLGVPEEAVLSQVGKQEVPVPRKTQEEERPQSKKTRRELLEEYLLSLAFQRDPQIIEKENIGKLLKGSSTTKLVSLWEKKGKAKEEFDPSEFAQELPGELVDLFACLILLELGEEFEDPQLFSREVGKVKREIEILNLREELAKLGEKIKELEAKGKQKELTKLEKEFTQAGERLARLEATTI